MNISRMLLRGTRSPRGSSSQVEGEGVGGGRCIGVATTIMRLCACHHHGTFVRSRGLLREARGEGRGSPLGTGGSNNKNTLPNRR